MQELPFFLGSSNLDFLQLYWLSLHNYNKQHHFNCRNHQECRKKDGIHWNASAHRNMTFMIVHHIIDSWGLEIKPSVAFSTKLVSEDQTAFRCGSVQHLKTCNLLNYCNFNCKPYGQTITITATTLPMLRCHVL